MQGWILPTTLFGVALLLSSVHLLTFQSIDARQMIAEMLSSAGFHQDAISTVRTRLSVGKQCIDIPLPHNANQLSYEVCGEESLPFISVPASSILPNRRVDYDALFSAASICPNTPLATQLTHRGAPRAPNDCLPPRILRGGTVVLDNIRSQIVEISPPSTGVALIASPGSISVSGELVTAGDLLVVSGGDVEIAAIKGASSAAVAVTIISSLGGITVGKTSGQVSLMVAGRSTLEVPETPTAPSFPMPPLRAPSLYGFRAVAREGS
jgi:hypothetical protein